jgi:phage/plasmid-like protein (TIGR03299 family)
MTAEISTAGGVAEMAFRGETPWHGMGQRLTDDAGIDTWTKEAGMAWNIKRAVVRYATAHQSNLPADQFFRSMPDRIVLFRDDNLHPLGVVSDSYKVVQPKQVMEFFRDLVENEGFRMETAGCLFDGRKFWALATIGDEAHIADKRDVLKNYLLLSTSADGSTATEGRFTSIRVVCNNTLSWAVAKDKAGVRVTHRSKFDPIAARGKLGILAHESFAGFVNDMRVLAEKPAGWMDLVKMTAELLVPGSVKEGSEAVEKAASTKVAKRIGELAMGAAIGSEFSGAKGTAYAWLQAVTQYVDHEARARSSENRLNSAWFGAGDNLKVRALELATAL